MAENLPPDWPVKLEIERLHRQEAKYEKRAKHLELVGIVALLVDRHGSNAERRWADEHLVLSHSKAWVRLDEFINDIRQDLSVAAALVYDLDPNEIDLEGLRLAPRVSEDLKSIIQALTGGDDYFRHLLEDCLFRFALDLSGYNCHLKLQSSVFLLPNVEFFNLFFENLVTQSWHDKLAGTVVIRSRRLEKVVFEKSEDNLN